MAEYLAMGSAVVKDRDRTADQISKLAAGSESAAASGELTDRSVITFQKYVEPDELTNEFVTDAYKSICVYLDGRFEIVGKYQDELDAHLRDLKEKLPSV